MSSRRTARRGAPARVPDWVAPQLATLAPDPPDGDEWLHEIKYDGYRVVARVDGTAVSLLTRNRKDWTERFPAVAAALAQLGLEGALLDGEVGVELEDGRTSFQALQNALRTPDRGELQYWVFDVLYLDGKDVTQLPLVERKALLEQRLEGSTGVIRYSAHVRGHGPGFLREACRHHLEGVISKRASAPYRSGRGTSWLKIKCVRQQEFVVGGYTEPSGSRQGLGALHVGTWDEAGRLVYRGKVGTGFSDAALRDLLERLRPLARPGSPFIDGPVRAAARGSHWVEPRLVAQIRYTELTDEGRLRHPSFEGLREDKPVSEVKMESAASGRVERAAGSGGRQGRGPSTDSVAGVRLSNPDRVLYPEQRVTKLELARYYEAVGPWMLPHIAERPLTLVRCPAGHEGQCFFQKHFDDSAPPAIRRIQLMERDGPEVYGVLDSTAGLVSLVQLGTLELHTWNSRADRTERPDRFIIDLDPDPDTDWEAVVDAALHVRDLLDELGLVSFLKTTGGKGLHIAVPLVRRTGWEEVKAFSGAVASLLSRAAPDLYTTEMAKRKRRGRILIDYLRNARGATAIEAYSTRARPGAPVAAPIHWDELADGVRADSFNVRNMVERMESLRDDPWKGIGAVKQSLTAPMKRRLGLGA
jgi:bifunctional non-homologous end joining protein LigD